MKTYVELRRIGENRGIFMNTAVPLPRNLPLQIDYPGRKALLTMDSNLAEIFVTLCVIVYLVAFAGCGFGGRVGVLVLMRKRKELSCCKKENYWVPDEKRREEEIKASL